MRWRLGIGDGPETNTIDDPVFFRGADYEIVGDKGIGPIGQAEGLDRLGGGGLSRRRIRCCAERSATEEEQAKRSARSFSMKSMPTLILE